MTTPDLLEVLKPERERRRVLQQDYRPCFTRCPACPPRGTCALCLSTRLVTKATARQFEGEKV